MKTTALITFFGLFGIFFAGCVEEGPIGPRGPEGVPGRDGLDAEIYYSPWYTPTGWSGKPGEWYFGVDDPNITEDIVEAGIILAYMSVPNDFYENAVRPMPAYALKSNWDFLIPEYGKIEFANDSQIKPGTANHYFRYVLIPSNIQLKQMGYKTSVEELKTLSYDDVCSKLGIPQ